MPLEVHRTTEGSRSVFDEHHRPRMTDPSGWRNEGNWVASALGSSSLAATIEAGRLEHRIIEVLRAIPHGDGPDDNRARSAFLSKLGRAFDDTALEDGYDHPAETILEATIAQKGHTALRWVRDAVLHPRRHTFGASVLRCLGRLDKPGESSWRSEIIGSALESASIELRDAAIQAVENWEDAALLPLLKRHEEPVPWLKEYIEQVVQDLGE